MGKMKKKMKSQKILQTHKKQKLSPWSCKTSNQKDVLFIYNNPTA